MFPRAESCIYCATLSEAERHDPEAVAFSKKRATLTKAVSLK